MRLTITPLGQIRLDTRGGYESLSACAAPATQIRRLNELSGLNPQRQPRPAGLASRCRMAGRDVLEAIDMRRQRMPVAMLVGRGNQNPNSLLTFAHSLFALLAERQAGQLRVFNRAGNLALCEQPEMFAAALRGFIHGVEAKQ